MKAIKLLTYAIFVLFLGFAVATCSGDDGATGPAGADGQDGNANVIYSEWITPTWSAGVVEGVILAQESEITATAITQEVVDSGLVFVYMKADDKVWQIPFSIPLGNSTLDIDFYFFVNAIHLYFYYAQLPTELPPVPSSTLKFRYLIIPGNMPGKSNANPQQAIYDELKNAGVDFNDYFNVCDYYGIDPE